MINISTWTDAFLQSLYSTFEDRVWFVGLQGSYGRGEATENSDIDMVVILDKVTADDIKTYNNMLDKLDHRELICGFLSGKNEILNWEPSDLFQLYYDTKSIKGSLDELISVIDASAVERAIKIGVCNIYHGCVHNMLYEKSDDALKVLYKNAFFVVQAIAFKENDRYISKQTDLLNVVSPREKAIINTFISLKNGADVDFEVMSEMLLDWSKGWIEQANNRWNQDRRKSYADEKNT